MMGRPSGSGRNEVPGSQGLSGMRRSGAIMCVFFSLHSHALPGKVGLTGLHTFSFFSSGILIIYAATNDVVMQVSILKEKANSCWNHWATFACASALAYARAS